MYRFIQNNGDFFAPGYYNENFKSNVFDLSGYDNDGIKDIVKRFSSLRAQYGDFGKLIREKRLRKKDIIKETHAFNSKVMECLGYDTSPAYASWIQVDDESVIPARSILRDGSGNAKLVVLEMSAMMKKDADDEPQGLFEQHYDLPDGIQADERVPEQRYVYSLWSEVIGKDLPEGCKISPSKVNECVTTIFRLDDRSQRPQHIVIFAGNIVYLLEEEKWSHGAYLRFDLEELFSEALVSSFRDYYALFYLLASKEVLSGDSQIVLMDKIMEASYKNAYEVTKDLKRGVIKAVELLANEALYYKKNIKKEEIDETSDQFAANVKDDCLTIIYRLLFIFYAEARPEIGILPMKDEIYAKGYSLDILRDLEQTPLRSEHSRNSYFFHDSLQTLFNLICTGFNDNVNTSYKSFSVKKIDSPLFDDKKLLVLNGVKFRNFIWQDIICSLSLSEEQARKQRGRISYANLGINQLGSVYESLLAYRGFYAEEDYIEVHQADDPSDGTFLVQRRRMDDFEANEILRDKNDEPVILSKGQFVYRLNGRDRKKSASYYTPEVLTKSTVKYTLKGFVERLEAGTMNAEELLHLKTLEPAMGAAAFQNEVVNQLAELYLTWRQKELGKHIAPQDYLNERQKVKAYIATKNIYGVDLNPTAIELGKLSLWLNVIHKDMETPFFAHRLALGNAVIGAWFKAYDENELSKKIPNSLKYEAVAWWEKAPHRLHFSKERRKIVRKKSEIYHFLIPDKNMLGVLNIKEEKAAHPAEAQGMQRILKDWTKPITGNDLLVLRKISDKIDSLLTEYIRYQEKIEKLTANNFDVWGHKTYHNPTLFPYDEKEQLLNSKWAKNNAYYKLSMIMNYWCALWFWEYDDAGQLPTREQFWNDIETILDIDFSKARQTLVLTSPDNSIEEPGLWDQVPEEVKNEDAGFETEENDGEENIVYTREEASKILAEYSDGGNLFDSSRTPIVERLANRYHFFHPMLEFIEVFWLRDGFDIIVGNPPWLKLEFEEKDIVSEKNPEVVIRKTSGPEVAAKMQQILSDPTMKRLFWEERSEYFGTSAFINSKCNYSLLVNQQPNLFKCILVNGFDLLSNSGSIGMLHPDGVFDDSHGQVLRRELYPRLRYHFSFINVLKLFAEILHWVNYSINIYGSKQAVPDFKSISNVFHPSTIDGCFAHDGHGAVGGLKVDGHWNTASHKERIVRFTEEEMRLLSITFENGAPWETVKLVNLQSRRILSILRAFSLFGGRLNSYHPLIRRPLDETNSVKSGIIRRDVGFPDMSLSEMIYSGSHIYVSNPLYKTPKKSCSRKEDFDTINLNDISERFIQRTNYKPSIDLIAYRSLVDGFCSDTPWIDLYKVGFRKMLSQSGERTLTGAILPKNSSHTNGIISVTISDLNLMVEFAGLTSSIVLDFYLKTIGASNLYQDRLDSFPLGVTEHFSLPIKCRTLLLNCLNSYYAPLWEQLYTNSFKDNSWSRDDARLKDFGTLSSKWTWETPLRNYFARRQALVEIDVLTSMALGLSLQDLELMYKLQFPVLQQNEDDTWYDTTGNIVFTCAKGLIGVGLDRPKWEQIRGSLSEDGKTYSGTSGTVTHTIDPDKSELYGGQQVTYYAPFTKCDRIEDYRRAWTHFEKVFGENQ